MEPPREVADEELDAAVAALRRGGLVALPTETVYGLGADARSVPAVRRIFEVKGRPSDHPLIVHLPRGAALADWASSVPTPIAALTEALWPGPLTVLVPRGRDVPSEVAGGRPTLALRVPAHPVALALLDRFGSGIAAPSANRFGRVSPTTAAHVRADLGADVDVVLDGGPCDVGVESTIVSAAGPGVEILRPGAVGVAELEAVLGAGTVVWGGDGPPVAPGMLEAHYAPAAAVTVLDDAGSLPRAVGSPPGVATGVLAPDALPAELVERLGPDVVELEPAGAPEAFARVLYDRLRQADRLGLERLVVVAPPPAGIGLAVRDRLQRAAAGSDGGPRAGPG